MKKLNLEFVNLESDYVVELDGKICEFKKKPKRNKHFMHEYQTENNSVHVVIKRFVPQSQKNWWLWQLLFFVTSLFGILDRVENKKCLYVDYAADINLEQEETNVKVLMRKNSKDKKAIELITEAKYQEQKNIIEVDKVAKKRLKTVKVISIIFWILLGLGLTALIFALIMN